MALRQAVWQGKLAASDISDKITVRNLQVTVNAGLDAWGREKIQPALVTVSLSLRKSFITAANADSVDESTVHYGHLSKLIRSKFDSHSDHLSTNVLADRIKIDTSELATPDTLSAIETDIFYAKGSMFGDGAGYMSSSLIGENPVWSKVLYLRNVRIPCLIGVNSNERLQKQPVVVNLWIECVPDRLSDAYPRVEYVLVEAISQSSFETLESLSVAVLRELRQKLFNPNSEEEQAAYIRLRIEKPMAVPFADAPSIEIMRPVRDS